ncbi:MAG: threonine ammonia-lyase [Dehalococcoidia bacterium]
MPSAAEVTIEDIEAAHRRLESLVRLTPVWPSVELSEPASPVLLKLENLQRTGSFKVRGAHNMLGAQDPAPERVVAASAGNHAQGVALAATQRGIASTVVMPATAPLAKRRATAAYGADIELVDGPLSAALERARELSRSNGWLFVPPFDAPEVVAGQGTLGLELIEQVPDLETVLVPAGGGGLLAGVALAVKSRRPEVRVIGVQTDAMPGILASRSAGRATTVEARRTIADGVAVAGPSTLTYDLVQRYVDDLVTVSEDAIASAVVFLIERARLVVEGAGALGVAALRSGAATARGVTVAVLSGGNIDVSLLGRLTERGLVVDGRRRRLTFAAANVPGELEIITSVLAEQRANVIRVEHDLATPDLPVGVARITLNVEADGETAFEAIGDALQAEGFTWNNAGEFVTPAASGAVR